MTEVTWLPSVRVCDQIPLLANVGDAIHVEICDRVYIYKKKGRKLGWDTWLAPEHFRDCTATKCLVARLTWR